MIGLLKMILNVAHDQTKAKQMVMGFVESTAKLFTYHQEEKTSHDDYSTMFNATVRYIKAHGGKPWHHLGLADLYKNRISKEMTRRETGPDTIPSTCRTEIANVAIEQGNKAANNEFLACQFIL